MRVCAPYCPFCQHELTEENATACCVCEIVGCSKCLDGDFLCPDCRDDDNDGMCEGNYGVLS